MTICKGAYGITCLLVALACAARLVHLDADPSIPTWIGYVTDEGRWTETARNVALFGAPDLRDEIGRIHLFLSPGYQAANYVVFRLLGIDFWSARVFAAVSGILIVLITFFALRRHLTPFALALGIVILGFETQMLALSRLALPEIPSVLASLLAFLVIALGRDTFWQAFLAGLFAAATVAMKGTSAPVVPMLLLLILLFPLGGLGRTQLLRAVTFLTGFALPIIAGLTVALALGLFSADRITGSLSRSLDFLSLSGPYTIVARFFDSPQYEARNLMLLGAWFCSWIWLGRASNAPPLASRLYLMSGCWAAWWLLLWSGNTYLPGRYLVHFIVPATIHIMAGLSLGQRDTLLRIGITLGEKQGVARAALLAWLVFPSAIIMASVLAGLAEICGWSVARLSAKLALIMALTGLIAIAARRNASRERVVAAFLVLPVMMTLLWLGGRTLGLFRAFWEFDSATSLISWMALLIVAIAASFVLFPRLRAPYVMVQSSVVIVLAAILLAQAAPSIVSPSFSIRDASRDLEQHLAEVTEVRSAFAGSLFLENKLKYREVLVPAMHYDGVVILDQHPRARAFLESAHAAHLVQVRTYPLMIDPAYGPPSKASVTIYKRK